MKQFRNLTLIIFISTNIIFGQIKLSELMIDPNGSEYTDEFIEIYNYSDSTIKLTDYYYLVDDDTLSISTFPDSTLEAEHYGIILDPDYDTTFGNYSGLIPDSVVQFTVGGSGFSLTNSSPKLIQILSESFALIDSHLTGNPFPDAGHSDERIKYDKNIWKSSLNINGTPGFKNSVSPDEYELEIIIDSCYFFDNEIIGTGEIINIGLNDIGSIDLQVWNDFNFDSIYTTDEFKYSELINDTLHSEDTTTFNFSLSYDLLGSNQIFAKVKNSTHNISDSTFKNVSVPLNEKDLLINEFYPIPVKTYAAEYLEIYSNTTYPVNLKDIKIADNKTSAVITNENNILRSHEYFVAVKDSSLWQLYSKPENWLQLSNLPSQNNSEDLIEIRNSNDLVIDMVDYKSLWDTGDDIAFERLSELLPSNESSSWAKTDTGSPGFENNNQLVEHDLIITISDYNYSNDLINFDVTVQNYSQNANSPFDINYCIDTDLNSKMTGETIYSTTVSEAIQPIDSLNISLNIPPYFKGANRVIVELDYSEDEDTTNNIDSEIINVSLDSNDFIITEFLRAPGDVHAAEYFEILSQSEKPINFLNLRFSDLTGTVTIENEVIVEKDSFFVFTESVELTESFPDLKNVCVMNNWRSLNNTSDQILLTDFYDNYIDKIAYTSDWNIPSDYSAELINPQLSSNEESNWKAVQPGSPGKTNLSFAKDNEVLLYAISIEDSVEINETISFSCVAKNIGQENINRITLQFFIDKNADSIYSSDEKAFSITKYVAIAPGDSTIITQHFTYDKVGFFDVKFFTDYSDNYYETLKIKYSEVPIILNEIMPSPNSDESEWIELVNISDGNVNLRGWQIGDNQSYSIISNKNLFLEKNEYLVISKDNNVMYNYPQCDGVFQNVDIPNLNSYDDKVRLKDFCGRVVDTMAYGNLISAKAEISFERKGEAIDRDWGYCENEFGGTPGHENSLLQNTYSITMISDNDYFYFNDTTKNFVAQLVNDGYKQLNDLEVKILFDGTKIFQDSILANDPGDTIDITISDNLDFEDGLNNYEVVVNSDEVNYTDSILIFKSFSEEQIFLNEVLFDPNTLYDQVEFIEFYLPNETLETQYWKLQVNNNIEEMNLNFNSKYVVVTKDTILQNTFPNIEIKYMEKFPTLTNDGALLKIIDPSGFCVDSVDLREYDEIKSGVSLEKSYQNISSSNKYIWKRSVSSTGFSPGVKNSITADSSNGNKITITPEIFCPATAIIPLEIKIESEIGMSFVELKIFDLRGRKLYSKEMNCFSQPTLKIFWDGKTNYEHYPTIGMYLVFVRVTDVNDKTHEYKKTLVVGD